jgi:MFS family permease
MLIVGRALQGTAGGGLTQLVSITISDMFSMRSQFNSSLSTSGSTVLTSNRSRTLYLGLLQAMWAVAGGVGPVLGGAFTQYASWRWNFWINLPISGSTFLLLLMFLDVHNPRTKIIEGIKAVDWFGSLSILGLMVMPLLGLNFGGTEFPWNSPKVICLIVFGSLMFVLFIFSEARLARYPLMPLGLFRQKSNVACLLVGFTHLFVSSKIYL